MGKVRRPTQAGSFYEATAETLTQQIRNCFLNRLGPGKLPGEPIAHSRRIIGLVCPHAGYMFSGPVASHAYYSLALDGRPDVVVLLGPNHTGYGSGLAVSNEGTWRTPLGDINIDTDLANLIVSESNIIDIDDSAHSGEHSIEVQLPFLQFLYDSKFKIVPICFLMQDLQSASEVGQALAKACTGKNVLVIASSDLTHYEPQEIARSNDMKVINAIRALDEVSLYSQIENHRITACGYGPICALIVSAKALGVKEAKLLSYQTSGDAIGDYSSVVGYAAVSFTK